MEAEAANHVFLVPQTVMPQGVEHYKKTLTVAGPNLVPQTVMPQGVEHGPPTVAWKAVSEVPQTVMPQGVEHIVLLDQRDGMPKGAADRDAARR